MSPLAEVTLAGAAWDEGVGEDGKSGSEVVPVLVCLHDVRANKTNPSKPALPRTEWVFMDLAPGMFGLIQQSFRLAMSKA